MKRYLTDEPSTDGFLNLPGDVIHIVIGNLAKAYLNVLSCVCKSLYGSITQTVTKLDLRQYYEITAAKIEGSLRRFTLLNELYIEHTKLKTTPSFSEALFGLQLKVFSAPCADLNLSFLLKLSSQFPNLEQLNLRGNSTNLKVLSSLSKLSRLQNLNISYSTGLNKVDITETLGKFESLRELSLAGIELNDFNSTSLTRLTNLHTLNVSDTSMRPQFSQLHLTSLTFLNFTPVPRPIELPTTLKTLDVDIGTFYSVPSGNVETLCVRKLNDFVDDLLSMTERKMVKTLELRQFKIVVSVFMSGVTYLLRRMPNIDTLLLDLSWDDGIGKFDENLLLFFTTIKTFETIKTLNLRITITTQQRGSLSMIWQGLISVIIQQRTHAIVSQFNSAIAIILREGDPHTGKSLICRYLNGRWWTTKRFLQEDERVAIPHIDNPRDKLLS